MPNIPKKYRLTLNFTVWINNEVLHPYSDEDELDTEEKRQLQAQRSLLKMLLEDKQGILKELLRKRVLEEAEVEVGSDDLKDTLHLRNLKDELLLEPIIDKLSGEAWNYFQEAMEQDNFEAAASEALSAVGVELEGAALAEVDETDEQDHEIS